MFRQLFTKLSAPTRMLNASLVERVNMSATVAMSRSSLHQMSGQCRPLLVNVVQARVVDVQAKRSKKKFSKGKKAAAANEEEEDEDEDDDEDEEGEDSGEGEVQSGTAVNTRLDVIGKVCFNIARAKFDECYYKNLVRVNGERAGKKSQDVRVGDEIDLIKCVSAENPQNLEVTRVQILKVDDKASSNGRIRISYSKTSKLVIKNYERDPFEGAVAGN